MPVGASWVGMRMMSCAREGMVELIVEGPRFCSWVVRVTRSPSSSILVKGEGGVCSQQRLTIEVKPELSICNRTHGMHM